MSLSCSEAQGRLPRRSEVWSKEPDQDSRGREGGWRDESLFQDLGVCDVGISDENSPDQC